MTTSPDWSADRYLQFEAERTRPARDLVAQIPVGAVRSAVDLGCGPGNSTAVLLERFPDAAVLGIDNSPDMLARARQRLPGVRFEAADIASWADPGPFDLLLANAALQWVPDHEQLFPALLHRLAPGGCLAVQMPDNLDEPSHRLMRDVAAEPPFREVLAEAAGSRVPRHPADWYWRLLRRAGARRVDVWRTTYHHPLRGAAGVVDWLGSTGLRPYLAPLRKAERADFLGRYEAAVAAAYPAEADGTLLLAFPRLFVLAVR